MSTFLWGWMLKSRRAKESRQRAAETADVDALRQAIGILDKAAMEIIREDITRFGEHSRGDLRWCRLHDAQKYLGEQLNDAFQHALGEKL